MGEETLAQWLLSPATLATVLERHAAIHELSDQIDLREDLAVLGEDARVGVHPDAIAQWAESSNETIAKWPAWLAPLLAALAVISAILWAAWNIATPFVIVVAIEAALTYRMRKVLDSTLHGTENAFHDLDLLSGMLERVESHSFRDARLQARQRELSSGGVKAFQAIARLRTLVDRINARHNVFIRIIDAPLMYSIQVAIAAERWRRAHGRAVRNWINIVGEMEALLSLATYCFEHPDDVFPEFLEGAARFDADQLGHPLLPAAACVRNSLAIGTTSTGTGALILLVSGSNMSGKSTLLRAVGINSVLAMAGAPSVPGGCSLHPYTWEQAFA